MPATASSMIFRSLRLLGEKEHGGTLSSGEQTSYLSDLNAMLESWSLERLMITQVVQESFALTASTASYTIGTNGVFATDRPIKIVNPCFTRDTSNVDNPLRLINVDAYGKIPVKSGSTGYPEFLYYDQGYSATSTATISLYPVPTSNLTLFINSLKGLQNFSTISHAAQLPPGYQRAIEFNFAIEVAGGFTAVSPEVVKIARESKAAIKSENLPDTTMRLDTGIVWGQRANILDGP